MEIQLDVCSRSAFSEISSDALLRCYWLGEEEGGKGRSGSVFKLLGFQGGGRRGGSCTSMDAENGQGGTKGVCFLFLYWQGGFYCLLPCSMCVGGWGVVIMLGRGDAGVILKEIHNRNCGVGASLWTAEEGWRGSPCWSDSLGPVEALANFGWAADVGEVAGGRVAAHNNNRCFPFLSWKQQEVGIAPLAGCRLAKIAGNTGTVCTWKLFCSILKLPSSSYLHRA